jgi:hypothetical protein
LDIGAQNDIFAKRTTMVKAIRLKNQTLSTSISQDGLGEENQLKEENSPVKCRKDQQQFQFDETKNDTMSRLMI